MGDIRSRLLRLAPGTTREARAVRRLLGHRLISTIDDDADDIDDATISRMAREEWLDILDGGQESFYQSTNERNDNDDEQSYEHPLWKDVSAPYRSVSSSAVCFYITTHSVKDTNLTYNLYSPLQIAIQIYERILCTFIPKYYKDITVYDNHKHNQHLTSEEGP